MEKYNKRILGFLIASTLLISGLLVTVKAISYNMVIVSEKISEEDVISECKGQDLEEVSKCLTKELREWYVYNLSNSNLYKGKIIDWEVIKEQGGVCWHAARWYVEKARDLGFYGETKDIFGDSKIGHEFAILYNKNLTEYCILDQKVEPRCFHLDGISKEEEEMILKRK